LSGGHEEMKSYFVGTVNEIPSEKPKIIDIEGTSIGVVKQNEKYYAVRNLCPHKLAPLCMGTVGGTMLPCEEQEYQFGLEGQVIRCPWHGWEFDLETGKALFETSNLRVTTYQVEIKNGEVYVMMKQKKQNENVSVQS
jgi:nitrite reductase/ring-hydroxylating ferredoxin subunit